MARIVVLDSVTQCAGRVQAGDVLVAGSFAGALSLGLALPFGIRALIAHAAGVGKDEAGISAEVIDPRTTWPLDKQALIDSAKKTSRALVVDEGYERYGVTAEISSVIAEGAFYYLDAPVKRMGAMDVPVPFSPVLEDLTVPSEQTVFAAARALCRKA